MTVCTSGNQPEVVDNDGVVDSGASAMMVHQKDLFLPSSLRPPPAHQAWVKGAGGRRLQVMGVGAIAYHFPNSAGGWHKVVYSMMCSLSSSLMSVHSLELARFAVPFCGHTCWFFGSDRLLLRAAVFDWSRGLYVLVSKQGGAAG